jgi:hypothetical protein
MEKSFYHTSDIDLATTLYTTGIPIDGIYNSHNNNSYGEPVMEFYFEDMDSTREMIKRYYARNLMIEPYILLLNRREMITRMKQEQRNEKNTQKSAEAKS